MKLDGYLDNEIDTGKLRKRIAIMQDATATYDAANQPVEQWKPFTQAWCHIRTPSGHEMQAALQVVGDCSHIVEMRYQPGITVEMDVWYIDGISGNKRVFDINAVIDPDELHKKLYLLCHEQTSGPAKPATP